MRMAGRVRIFLQPGFVTVNIIVVPFIFRHFQTRLLNPGGKRAAMSIRNMKTTDNVGN
jgi:hypothetical protein